MRSRRLLVFSIGDQGLSYVRQEPLPLDIPLIDALPLRDGYAFPGLYGDAAVYVAEGGVPETDKDQPGVFRKLGVPPLSASGRRQLVLGNRSFADSDPDGERIAIGFIARSQVQFHRADGSSSLYVSDTVRLREPLVGEAADVTQVVDVATTEENVFVLFCGCRVNGELPREVLVYDWSGKLLAVMVLDNEVYSIAVTRDGQLLYGGIEEPEPILGVWQIPDEW